MEIENYPLFDTYIVLRAWKDDPDNNVEPLGVFSTMNKATRHGELFLNNDVLVYIELHRLDCVLSPIEYPVFEMSGTQDNPIIRQIQ